MSLTVGSLFAGIGGFDLGFTRAGFKVRWQVEIDPWARKVLERHFPNAKRFYDVRHVGAHNLERVDVLCGGFPCQDISKAGNRRGLAGERSGLWAEMLRIVRELRPGHVVVENVTGLLIPDDGWDAPIGTVLGDLAESGYDAEWECLPAAAFGAPHLRDRTFIVAYANGVGPIHRQAGRLPTEAGMQAFGDAGASGEPGNLRGQAEGGWAFSDFEWLPEPAMDRVVDGLPGELDKAAIRGLGNAIVPRIVEWIAQRIALHQQSTDRSNYAD